MIPVLGAVAAGGAIGATLRYLVSRGATALFPTPFVPYGTLLVNVVGSFAIGICWARWETRPASDTLQAFVRHGLLGALTTYSTFALDTIELDREHGLTRAGVNVALHLVLGIGAAALGIALARPR